MVNGEEIIFYILLVDAIGTNIIAWFFEKWYKRNNKKLAKYFPATKGWATLYLILVLLIGYLIYK